MVTCHVVKAQKLGIQQVFNTVVIILLICCIYNSPRYVAALLASCAWPQAAQWMGFNSMVDIIALSSMLQMSMAYSGGARVFSLTFPAWHNCRTLCAAAADFLQVFGCDCNLSATA
jgi:hypothetical protein